MNYLKWNLDTEEGIDVFDPLGDLKIYGDEGKLIEENTYLDAFFEALVEASKSIEVGRSIIVDPVVEPDNIEFNCKKDALEIIYGQQKTVVHDRKQFVEDVRQAVRELLRMLDEQSEFEKQQKPKLSKLRNYLKEKT